MKRLFAGLTACLMLFATGCTNNNEDTTAPTEVEMGENTIAYIGDIEMTRDDLNAIIHLLVPTIQQYTGASEGWENIVLNEGLTARDVLTKTAVEQYRDQLAFIEYVKGKGLYTDADAEEDFEALIESTGGKEAFDSVLQAYSLKGDAFRMLAAYNGAYTALMENSCTDEAADKIYNEDYITAKHILVLFEGRENEEAAYNEAFDLYKRAKAGESFEELIKSHGEDPGQDPETGYTFTIGTMVDEFYEGALKLEEGGISEPVKTTYGYHVIKKYPNPGKDSAVYADTIADIKSIAASNLITEEVYQSIIEPYPLTINESVLSSIDLSMYTIVEDNVNYGDGSVFNE